MPQPISPPANRPLPTNDCHTQCPFRCAWLGLISLSYATRTRSGAAVGSAERSTRLGVHETLKKADQLDQRWDPVCDFVAHAPTGTNPGANLRFSTVVRLISLQSNIQKLSGLLVLSKAAQFALHKRCLQTMRFFLDLLEYTHTSCCP